MGVENEGRGFEIGVLIVGSGAFTACFGSGGGIWSWTANSLIMTAPIFFKPIYQERVWGARNLSEALGRDLWVLEIEDRDGRHFLEEPVEQPGD